MDRDTTGRSTGSPRGTGPAPGAPRPRFARGLRYAALGALGVLVGAAGGLVQSAWFPLGLLLALAGSAALFYGGAVLTGTRAGGWVPAGTWLLAVIALTTSRPEGDFVFGAGLGPYVYLLCGSMAGVMSATLPRLPRAGGPNARLGK